MSEQQQINVNFQSGKSETFYLAKRPYLEEFLQQMNLHYKITVYTSSQKEYADCILGLINYNNAISERYYRDSCKKTKTGFIKDLGYIKKNLTNSIFIDNSQQSVKQNERNSFLIPSFLGNDEHDNELYKFQLLLTDIAETDTQHIQDIRTIVKQIKNSD